MKSWIKEPMVHFLTVGVLLFVGDAWLERDRVESRVMRVGAAEVNWLKETWERQRTRRPTEDELKGLLASYLKEEILAAEAKELGLDQNDTIVRRRLAQKLEFLVQDTARLADPTEGQLRDYLAVHRERYQTRSRVSFSQIYFKTENAARAALEEVSEGRSGDLGERFLLDREFALADRQAVANLFGVEFAGSVFGVEPGRWQGPFKSSYGFHLVQVTERQAARPRPYEEVRRELLDDWHRSEQARAMERFVARLFKKYRVVVEDSVQPLIGPLAGVAQ